MRGVFAALVVLIALAETGCGGDPEEARELARAIRQAGPGALTCSGKPEKTGFPAGAGITYVARARKGGTTIVTGYSTNGLEHTFGSLKFALRKEANEVNDAELGSTRATIDFEHPAGAGEGRIFLRTGCPGGRTSIRVLDYKS